jgi:hypothetical protein
VFRDMIKYAETTGDETMRQAIDYVLADELTHVRFGSDWVKEFTRDDPEHFQRAQDFRRQVTSSSASAERAASAPTPRSDRDGGAARGRLHRGRARGPEDAVGQRTHARHDARGRKDRAGETPASTKRAQRGAASEAHQVERES